MALGDATVFELARRFRFQWEPAQGAYVLLYPEGMVKLGQSAGEILKRVDGTSAVSEIVADLRAGVSRRGPAAGRDRLSGACHMEKAGSHARQPRNPPLWLLAELTYRCPLHCVFCYNPVDYTAYGAELATDDWVRVLREGRELGATQLGFSGGEPLMRDDLEILVAEAQRLGYYSNLHHLGRRPERTARSRRSRTAGSTTSSCRSRTPRAR